MHFMNPVPVMKLVEVIPGLATRDDVLQDTLALAKSMGKTTTVAADIPGFVANRLLMPYINEAVMLLENVSRSFNKRKEGNRQLTRELLHVGCCQCCGY